MVVRHGASAGNNGTADGGGSRPRASGAISDDLPTAYFSKVLQGAPPTQPTRPNPPHGTEREGRRCVHPPPLLSVDTCERSPLISGCQTQTYTRADLRADRKADNRARMLTQSPLPVRLVPLSRDQSACPSALPARASAAVMCSRRSLVPHAPPSPRCQVFKHCAAHTAARDPGTTLASELPLICRKTFKNES